MISQFAMPADAPAKFKRAFAKAVLAAIACLMPVAAHADVLVIRATGPSAADYPRGTMLADNARITLRNGDVITVLDDNGTRVLSGPRTIALNRASTANNDRIKRLAQAMRDTKPSRAGAVRGAGANLDGSAKLTAQRPSNLWFVDMTMPGTYCLIENARPKLFRAMAGNEQRLRLDPETGGQSKLVYVPKDANSVSFPMAQLAEGGSKRWLLRDETDGAGAGDAHMISLLMIKTPDEGAAAMAAALLRYRCDAQLAYFSQSLKQDDAPPMAM